jgi:hypothetical protein
VTDLPTVVSERDHFLAICARLAGTGRPVGKAEAPKGIDPPFLVVYPLAGGSFDGVLDDIEADVVWPFQITCVAELAGEALLLVDEARRALTVEPIEVPGRRTCWVHADGGPAGARRDDTVQPSLFYATPRFTLATTPTT